MLREFVTSTILAGLTQAAGLSDDAEGRFRATLVASQVVGLGFTRYVLRPGAAGRRRPPRTWSPRSAPPCSAT